MKKILLIFMIFPLCFFLFGCQKNQELGSDSIITTIYANYDDYDFYEVSAEILSFNENEKSYIKTAYGKNLEDAYFNLMKNIEKEPYTGHTNALLLGDGICEKSLSEAIDFFSDINEISPNINVLLTEDNFSDFLPLEIYEKIKNNGFHLVPAYSLFIPKNNVTVIPVIKNVSGKATRCGGIITEDMIFKKYIDENSFIIYSLLTNTYNEKYYSSYEIINSNCKIKKSNNNLDINLNLIVKNLGDENKDFQNIYRFISQLKNDNLESVLKKGDFEDFKVNIKITTPHTGKIKNKKGIKE